ncbi:proline-rich receptor-like protein kinase PERK2 isoform X2 [Phragmites australis]|uniref:proline-rich receptor-like protein kinase PERK2 isoform X2 n=1 Tax=Phragmites australis TaxID=29695 RepID=UPI002D76C06E|nr:proline-rich receptor-like protein kinase PERK2 isoform X2 [Phragmites australis]
MADPVVIVEKIVNIAYAIKEAVETVRENKEECRGIEQRVLRVSDLLSLLKGSEMMKHRAMSRALEDLEDAVSRAHEVVTACQGRNILCLFCFAGKLAKKLRQVKDDISQRMMLAIFASHVAVFVVTKSQYSDQPSFFIPRNQYPLSKHPPSPPPLAVVKDLSPSLPTHLPPPVVIGEDLVSRLPPHVPPSPSLVVADVSNIPPRSHAHLPPSLSSLAAYIPPATLPRTNLAPPQSKHLPSYPPTKPPPPPPPPPPATYIPSSTPANLAPHLSKRLLPRPPTKLPSPQPPPPRSAAYIPPPTPPPANLAPPSKHLPSRSPPTRLPPPPLLKHLPPLAQPPLPPPSTPIADIAPHLPKHLYLRPPEHVPPRAPTQRTGEISVPASGSVSSTLSVEDLSGKSEVQDETKKVPSGSEVSSPPFPGLTKFSLSELKAATHNFSEENKIGSSDFGTVYKGVLCNRLVVAIKEFRDPPPFLMARICAELLVASELQSKKVEALGSNGRKLSLTAGVGKSENTLSGRNENIIGVLGYGHEFMWKHRRVDHHIFLVEEYMPNGNMDNIIYGDICLQNISWKVFCRRSMMCIVSASSSLRPLAVCAELNQLVTTLQFHGLGSRVNVNKWMNCLIRPCVKNLS